MSAPQNWNELCDRLSDMFGMDVDLNGVLYLVGVRERGLTLRKFTKFEKWSLINLGSCVLYKEIGMVEELGTDRDGWPMFREKSLLTNWTEERKQKTLQDCAIRYFSKVFEDNPAE
ncbi:hypothetical protein [Prolixibacter denitrificans]|uniref:Uncharacterized protein n=1 Tax=Prolixibacter denitrificans TaxID=1541063 RepID=A0A2P8CHG1_9BACT|nr:hypothetical protein [Prolixibacter denitrificans]PSK84414.1 hypothetical protein CLV93_102200 [Prolixibacter denitrificans]GET20588.1 hypothetical protein JCM18694_08340 [Prolixibacter denitrificans]